MKSENCYICKGNTNILYSVTNRKSKTFDLVRCDECGLVRINPIPEQQEVNKLYAGIPITEKYMDNEVYSSPLLTSLKKSFLIKPLINKFYKSFSKDRPDLLDIGCSTGWITNISRETGFEVTGLEANENVANYGRKKYGIKIIEGFVEDLDTDKSFDAVTMFHVLEHIIDPQMLLDKVHTLLKEKGRLLVVVPNGESLGVKLFKETYNWNVPHHISFFTPDSISQMFKSSGFRIIELTHLVSSPLLLYSFNRYMRKRNKNGKLSFRIKNKLVGNAIFYPLGLLGKILNQGEVIAVFAEKEM